MIIVFEKRFYIKKNLQSPCKSPSTLVKSTSEVVFPDDFALSKKGK